MDGAQAGRQRRKKLQHLTAAKLLPDDDLLGRIDAVDLEHVAPLPPCLIGMEACATAHYWARELTNPLLPSLSATSLIRREH